MKRAPITLMALFLLAGSTLQAGEYYTKVKGDQRRGEPTEDRALVYVFRPAAVGAAIKTWAFYDEELLGVSKKTAYFFGLVPEGKHVFWSKAENTSALELEVKGGETYYLKQGIKMGWGKARVQLTRIDAEEAEKYFKKCSFVEVTEEGRARAREIASNRLDRAHNKVEKQKEKEEKGSPGSD